MYSQSSGMDPISRRYVWDHITKIKPGRVVLLTTHAMEEADLLSDSVAIVCNGKLVASGSPLELKHEYGSAVQFSVIVEKQHIHEVKAHISRHFSVAEEMNIESIRSSYEVKEHTDSNFSAAEDWINIESSDSGYITVSIKKVKQNRDDEGVDPSTLSAFIGWLEQEDTPVMEFSLSNSSLEEVFLALTKTHHSVDQPLAEMKSMGCCCKKKDHRQTYSEENQEDQGPVDINLDMQPKASLSEFSRNLSVNAQTLALFRFFMKRNWQGRSSIVNWATYGFFCVGNMMLGFGLAVFWPDSLMYYFLLLTGEVFALHYQCPTTLSSFVPLLLVFLLSMILVSLISPIYSDRNLGLFQMMVSCLSYITVSYITIFDLTCTLV